MLYRNARFFLTYLHANLSDGCVNIKDGWSFGRIHTAWKWWHRHATVISKRRGSSRGHRGRNEWH